MKNLRKIVLLLLSLTLIFGLFACGGGSDPCTECTDSDGDGKCDVCGGKVEKEPCETCVDSDGDGKCDVCGEAAEPEPTAEIPLIVDGKAQFQIVLASDINVDVRKAVTKDIQSVLKNKYKVTVEIVTEGTSSDSVKDVEILIGGVDNRGEKYQFDRYSLGKKGYIIKMIDSKIIVDAGSDETLVDLITTLAEDILGMGEKTLPDSAMTAALEKDKVQDDYKITSISVNGTSMKGYTIAVDKTNSYLLSCAKNFQDELYARTGIRLEIVNLADATDKSVIFEKPETKVRGEESFKISAEGTKLVVSSSFDNLVEKATAQFILANITTGKGDIDFKGTVYKQDISVVHYEDFGAKGDGRTNDYQAFYETHAFANECGQTVVAVAGKNYYLEDPSVLYNNTTSRRSIPIKTDVIWTGASITIDDSRIDTRTSEGKASNRAVFQVLSDYDTITWKRSSSQYEAKLTALDGIGYSADTKKIDLGLGYPAMLIIYNENHGVYRRYGSSYEGTSQQEYGSAQHEIIIVDAEGNIDPSTKFMFDYDEVTKIDIYNLNIEPRTIKGGDITTIACQVDASILVDGKESTLGYYSRGLQIKRSFTTVDGVNHYMEGEITLEQFANGIEGTQYNGFYNAEGAANVTIQNCIMTGRRNYGIAGTYEFSAANVSTIILKNCTQSNFWLNADGTAASYDTGIGSMDSFDVPAPRGGKIQYCWGLGGTNFCKNMHYIDSQLSRFDAHCGLYNGSIIDSEIQYVEIIGKGTFTIKNTDVYIPTGYAANSLFYLRSDYGSTWEGTLIVDNVTAYVNDGPFYIFHHSYANFYFGYTCYIPNMEITDLALCSKVSGVKLDSSYDQLKFFDGSMESQPYMHTDDLGGKGTNENPVTPPDYIKIVSNKNGYSFRLPYQTDGKFLSGVKYYSGDEEVEVKSGKQKDFLFY